jgi:hypothetical protein
VKATGDRHTSSSPAEIRDALAQILASEGFRGGGRRARLLHYLVDETLAGRGDHLKGFTIALDVFGRGDDFDPQAAILALEKATKQAKGFCFPRSLIPRILVDTGMIEEARKVRDELVNGGASGSSRTLCLVEVYAVFPEDTDNLFEALEQDFDRRGNQFCWLKTDPKFDPYRDDPRFKALLKKVGLDN